MISERKTDIELKYIFINKFDYRDPLESESFNAHPRVGHIYHSAFNVHTKHHRLILPDGVLMGFNSLKGDSGSAEFDMVEITLNNILDFNIKEEDLEVFLRPDDFGHHQPMIIIEGLKQLQEAMVRTEDEEVGFAHVASESIMDLWRANPVKAEILVTLADYLTETDLDSYSDPGGYLRLHPTKGMAVNIVQALRALDTYASDDVRISEDESDLLIALEAIVTEYERLITKE